MKKFTQGLIAGGMLGIVGIGYALSDKRTRRRMRQDTKKMVNKASGIMDNMTDMF